ncbi:MAG: Fic family protein [Thermodesulfobacteriota bacterium]
MTNTQDLKARNEEFARLVLLPHLCALSPRPLPVGQLAIFFHVASGLGYDWLSSCLPKEAANVATFLSLRTGIQEGLIDLELLGQTKPDAFIHSFDRFFTLSGASVRVVLPIYFSAVDSVAEKLKNSNKLRSRISAPFLAAVYLGFLIMHPFVDGNGRVIRAVVQYFNDSLKLGFVNSPWYDQAFGFRSCRHHKRAFAILFADGGVTTFMRRKDSNPATNLLDAERSLRNYLVDIFKKIADEPTALLQFEPAIELAKGF